MPTIKRVTLGKERECSKCKQLMSIGTITVRDCRDKKRKGAIYYHTECLKRMD